MSEFIYNEDDSNHPVFKNTTVKTKKSLTETINETLQKPAIDIGLLSEVKITHEISE